MKSWESTWWQWGKKDIRCFHILINRKLPVTVMMVIYSLNKLSSDFLRGFSQDSAWSILNSWALRLKTAMRHRLMYELRFKIWPSHYNGEYLEVHDIFSAFHTCVSNCCPKKDYLLVRKFSLSGASPVVAEKTEKDCAKGISIFWCCKL